jgi:hypothetical protein
VIRPLDQIERCIADAALGLKDRSAVTDLIRATLQVLRADIEAAIDAGTPALKDNGASEKETLDLWQALLLQTRALQTQIGS